MHLLQWGLLKDLDTEVITGSERFILRKKEEYHSRFSPDNRGKKVEDHAISC